MQDKGFTQHLADWRQSVSGCESISEWSVSARLGNDWLGRTRLGKTWRGMTWLGMKIQGEARFHHYLTEKQMNKQPDFRLSADSAALVKVLELVDVGATVTYAELSQTIGRDVTSFRGPLETARLVVQREKRMVFDAVRGEGLRRLADDEIVDLSDKARDHARRHARKTAKKLVCVDYQSLNKQKQTKHNAALSMFGALAELTTSGSQKRLEAKVEAAGTQLASARSAMDALGAVL